MYKSNLINFTQIIFLNLSVLLSLIHLISCTCQVPNTFSRRQEAILTLQHEVITVNRLTTDLAHSSQLTRQSIEFISDSGICSERIQNSARKFLADKQIMNKSMSDSKQVFNQISSLIDQIIQLFDDLHQGADIEKAHTTVSKINTLRAKAKPLNRELLANAGVVFKNRL